MSSVHARSKNAFNVFALVAMTLLTLTLAFAGSAAAQEDSFANGDGHDSASLTSAPNGISERVANTRLTNQPLGWPLP